MWYQNVRHFVIADDTDITGLTRRADSLGLCGETSMYTYRPTQKNGKQYKQQSLATHSQLAIHGTLLTFKVLHSQGGFEGNFSSILSF